MPSGKSENSWNMWRRPTKPEPSDAEEHQAENDLWELLRAKKFGESEPASAYWQSLIVETNRSIDAVSSGRALSVSWAARVAIPGAIAILFFFIGLHYYVPQREPADMSVTELMLSLPTQTQDSLAARIINGLGDVQSESEVYDQLFEPAGADLSEYLSVTNREMLLETLPDDQIDDLLMLLRKKNEI
jgi:hypothetical protein